MMRRGRGQRTRRGPKHGSFDPYDASTVKHTRLGVWDLYEQVDPGIIRLPGVSELVRRLEILNDLPYVWRMLKDVASIKSCWLYFLVYCIVELLSSLLPAVTLWFSGHYLSIIQTAIEHGTVDRELLLYSSVGRLGCSFAGHALRYFRSSVEFPLNLKIKKHYSIHIFDSMARLDVPTFDDPLVQARLDTATTSSRNSHSLAWDTITVIIAIMTAIVRLGTQLSVLMKVVGGQRDGIIFVAMHFGQEMFRNNFRTEFYLFYTKAWAATTKDRQYVKLQGLKRTVNDHSHRKEIVAGNLEKFLSHEFRYAYNNASGVVADFYELLRHKSSEAAPSLSSLVSASLRELPEIFYLLRAAEYPASIPVSIASMRLVQQTTSSFMNTFMGFLNESGSIAERFHKVRQLYEIENIPNNVVDGNTSFPEDMESLKSGMSVEFRNVSFKYPGSETMVLRDISFKIGKGQLCVIVGSNGSGKSTVLKLILRLYDPTEGAIFINDQDIRILKLADLRECISVLFQDYTHFPLTIGDNIALGSPQCARDGDKVRAAARLGGAEDFVDKLPEGFDTYLDRPVRDYYSGIPEGTQSLFGRSVNFGAVSKAMGGVRSSGSVHLSGGQMQRLAVSRSFMRSLLSEEQSVGLLLFDEPSAALDPTAEHDLFVRLRNLRGQKTMIFSSHRFGQLTRPADLILYMNDTKIVEAGTHTELMERGGEYAGLWNLQAQAFL